MGTTLEAVRDHIATLGAQPRVIPELPETMTISVTDHDRLYQILICVEDGGDTVRFRSFRLGESILTRPLVCDLLSTFNATRKLVRGSIDGDGEVVLDFTLFLVDMELTRKATTQALALFVKNLVILDGQLRGIVAPQIQA